MSGKVMLAVVAVLGAVAIAGAAGAKGDPAKAGAKGSPAKAGGVNRKAIERGEYLVRVAGCDDCHTPMGFDEKAGMPVRVMERRLSGHPVGAPVPASTLGGNDLAVIGPTFTSFRMPFGVVYATNLTPDVETGIGGWTEANFVQAMRTGRHLGQGRAILPPMPWFNVAAATDEDLKAMFAYLKSLPPVKNRVPDNQVAPAVYQQQEKANGAIVQTIGRKPKH